MRRCFSVVACATAAVLLTAGPAAAKGAGGGISYTAYDNLVQIDPNSNAAVPAVSTGSAVSFDTGNGAVTNGNLAYSHAVGCTGCRTVTVALQAVVIEANPTNVQPQNAAVALNESCNSCLTFAYAHQYLFSPHHVVQIDGETRDRLGQIQTAVNWVANSNADFPTMSSQLDQLSWAFCDTVQRSVNSQQEGQHADSTSTPSVCGAAPFDHRQVQEHD